MICSRRSTEATKSTVFTPAACRLPSLLTCTSDGGGACDQNELAILEFIHCIVETLDRFFANVCELDIMFHIDKVLRSSSHMDPTHVEKKKGKRGNFSSAVLLVRVLCSLGPYA